jgi:hypothetical protein
VQKEKDLGPEAKDKSVTVEAAQVSTLEGSIAYGPLLERFFERNGGMDKLLGIYSIKIHGTVIAEEGSRKETFSFTMVKKPPGQVRLNMLNEDTKMEATVLTDGTDTWEWRGDSPEKNGVQSADANAAAALMREAMYSDVAVEVLRSPRVLRELPRQASSDEPYDVIEMLLPHDVNARIYLDPKTSRAQRIDLVYDNGGVPNLYTIFVHDWMEVEGVPEPKSLTVFDNGAKVLDCVFDSISYNEGAYDSLFERPTLAPAAPAPAASTTAPAGSAPPPNGSTPPPATAPAK